ncbi:MAG: hypothetical protein JWQ01_2840 [Massilia sp.]|nr:hypothetical protein [Massilia sp.]
MSACRLLTLFRRLWLLPLALCFLQPAATAQEVPAAALNNAIVSLAQFRQQVADMRAQAQQPLGPFRIESSCSWCSAHAWWGFGTCTETTHASWGGSVDFSWTRGQLHDTLARADQDAGAFAASFAPTQAWIDGLPAFSRSFDAAADLILGVQQAIKAGQTPTDAQRQQVTQALEQLTAELTRSSTQLQAGTRALAVSLQQQSSYRDAIRAAIDGSAKSAEAALANAEKSSMGHPCQDGVPAQFAAIRANFSASTARIQGSFQQLDARSRDAENALAVLLGGVVNAQTQMKSILSLVTAAGNDKLGSFLEQLHLAAAKKQWSDLAQAQANIRL